MHEARLILWHIVISALVVFFILSLIIYNQTKEKAFKYYALYNLFLLFYLSTKTVYIEPIVSWYANSRFFALNWMNQIIYNTMMVFFYIHLLDLYNHYKKQTSYFVRFLTVNLIIAILLFFISIVLHDTAFIKNYFLYLFTPLLTTYGLYFLKNVYVLKNTLSKLVLCGTLIYTVFVLFALYKTLINDYSIAPITYLLIGVFVESLLFMTALGFKVKNIYSEKIIMQQNVIIEKTKLNELKEKHQKELEDKLLMQEKLLRSTLEKTENEKIELLKSQYENEILNLKLDALRSQMNPHFIFNALNSIKVYFIENNKEKAVYYLNKFSKLIRNILEFSKREYITVKEELEVIELYLTIENIRFNNAISLIFEQLDDAKMTEKRIPGLILQPFVENSIWHGLMRKEGHKEIKIGCISNNHKTGLFIQDNGIGREKAKENKMNSFKKDSLGIEFSLERLNNFNLQNQLNYTFEIIDLKDEKNQPNGTKVILWLS